MGQISACSTATACEKQQLLTCIQTMYSTGHNIMTQRDCSNYQMRAWQRRSVLNATSPGSSFLRHAPLHTTANVRRLDCTPGLSRAHTRPAMCGSRVFKNGPQFFTDRETPVHCSNSIVSAWQNSSMASSAALHAQLRGMHNPPTYATAAQA